MSVLSPIRIGEIDTVILKERAKHWIRAKHILVCIAYGFGEMWKSLKALNAFMEDPVLLPRIHISGS